MTDCSSIHGSSSSSDITSSRGSSNPRIRVIRLTRPQYHQTHAGNPSFGFSLRGGREYGTGFFISRVEKGSEADVQGLRVFLNLLSLFFQIINPVLSFLGWRSDRQSQWISRR